MGQNIGVVSLNPGGRSSALNILAQTLIKQTPGILFRAVLEAAGTSGALTFNDANVVITTQTVTAITQAANAVATLSTGGSTNPFAVGNSIVFASVAGMTQINGVSATVTAIGGVTTAWTVTTSINSTAFTAYSSGGTAASFGAGNQIFTLPFASTALIVPGTIFVLDFPCQNGILVSAVQAGGMIASVSYS